MQKLETVITLREQTGKYSLFFESGFKMVSLRRTETNLPIKSITDVKRTPVLF